MSHHLLMQFPACVMHACVMLDLGSLNKLGGIVASGCILGSAVGLFTSATPFVTFGFGAHHASHFRNQLSAEVLMN